jgi:hypothetical protein
MHAWYHDLPALNVARSLRPVCFTGAEGALGGLPFAGFAKGGSALLLDPLNIDQGVPRAHAPLRR